MSKLIENKAETWTMKVIHDCGSSFEIDKDDVVYVCLVGNETVSTYYHVVCPACSLEHPIKYSDLPSWVQRYASRNNDQSKK